MHKKSILIQAWNVHKIDGKYYLPFTHWIYLKEISQYYASVCLLSPVNYDDAHSNDLLALDEFPNVQVMDLPFSGNYIKSIKYFLYYIKAYRKAKGFDVAYARYPIPFGWLQKFFFKGKTRIIHFVGDPIDVTNTNPNFGKVKKALLITFFMPEHFMYMWACKGAKVFTNGFHLSEKLKKHNIEAIPLISSTLTEDDFFLGERKISESAPKIIYVGYLRKAKGIETVLRAFSLLQTKYPGAILSIVGTGEFRVQLEELVVELKLSNVNFLGHIDDRKLLNKLLREHDIFCFASVSEGSPRVILEAMANGINVVSTPVGSLPAVFSDNDDIVYAAFNDESEFYEKMDSLIKDHTKSERIRTNAYHKALGFNLSNFIKKIFHEI